MAATKKKAAPPKKASPKKPTKPAPKARGKPAAAPKPSARPPPTKAAAPRPAAAAKSVPVKAAPAQPAPAPAKAPPTKPAAKPAPPKPAAKPAPPAPAPPPEPVAKAPPKKAAPPPVAPPVAPVLKPTGSAPQKVVQAPLPPPPPKQGFVDSQLFSAVSYGLFAAINKTFGTFGQSVLKNASLRILEYGYKKQWLPPKSKDPIKALNEWFGRLETMGYAERVHISKKDEKYVLEMHDVTHWDAIAELKELHYPLLPVFESEMILAFLDQYFGLIVAMEPVEFVPEKRGLRLRFTTHSRTETVAAPVHHERPIHADLED